MAQQPAPTTAGLLESIRYVRGVSLEFLDQTLLPGKFQYVPITNSTECFEAIRSMKIRGAPAIGCGAALCLANELHDLVHVKKAVGSPRGAEMVIIERSRQLQLARPTAVNLHNCCQRIRDAASAASNAPGGATTAGSVWSAVADEAESLFRRDKADNMRMGELGAQYILAHVAAQPGSRGALCSLTHCNAGALATASYGTALGVIRALKGKEKLARAFCTETRPWNQGARLTSFELSYEGIPTTLVVDSAVCALLGSGRVDFVVVGADRICANGDVANKIGTYGVAVAARRHGVPFFVAAPVTTIDPQCPRGSCVPIEERPAEEVTGKGQERRVADGVEVWNPSFDVTPAELITAIFTERGVITHAQKQGGAYDDTLDVLTFLSTHPPPV